MPKPTKNDIQAAPTAPTAPKISRTLPPPSSIDETLAEAAAAPSQLQKLMNASRELLAAVPHDIAALPGTTPASYARYLAARKAMEAALV